MTSDSCSFHNYTFTLQFDNSKTFQLLDREISESNTTIYCVQSDQETYQILYSEFPYLLFQSFLVIVGSKATRFARACKVIVATQASINKSPPPLP